MLSRSRSTIAFAWLAIYALAVLLLTKTDAIDCDRYCKTHRVNIGNCRCRPELFVKKSMPSGYSDLNQDILLGKLFREYLEENGIEERK